MSESLTPYQPKTTAVAPFLENWDKRIAAAQALLKSGFLPQAIKTPEQVIAITMKGEELGIPWMEALAKINVIQGKPTVSPELMLALCRRTRELEDIKIEHTSDSCAVTVKRKGQSPHTTRFGAKEAKSMNLAGKDNYTKQASTMYQWRAIAANLRVTFADAIGGLYTHEELNPDAKFDEEGNIQVQGLPSAEVENPPVPTTTEEAPAVFTEEQPFDPYKDTFGLGKKYPDMLWIDVPQEALVAAAKHHNNQEVQNKVTATLKAQKERSEQETKEIFK